MGRPWNLILLPFTYHQKENLLIKKIKKRCKKIDEELKKKANAIKSKLIKYLLLLYKNKEKLKIENWAKSSNPVTH